MTSVFDKFHEQSKAWDPFARELPLPSEALEDTFGSRGSREIQRLPPTVAQIQGSGGTGVTTTGSTLNPIFDVNLGSGQLRQESLGDARDMRGQVNADIQTLRGLENPFVQARVRPLEQARDERTAQLTRDVRRRGGFNSLTENFIGGQERLADQQIGDQRVIATQESQGAVRQAQQFSAMLSERIGNIGQEEINQAAAEIGLGQNQLQLFLDSQKVSGETSSSFNPGEAIGSIFSIVGGIMGMCSREWKDIQGDIDTQKALEIIESLPVVEFTYKEEMGVGGDRHICTIAEDFNKEVFGAPAQTINLIDYIGVMHGAMKAMAKRLNELEAQNA